MHYSPLEEVNCNLPTKRQEFVLRRQSGIAAPLFPLNRYSSVDSNINEYSKTEKSKQEVRNIDLLGERCFKLNVKCDDSFSSLQNYSYSNDSTLVNSTINTQTMPDLLPAIASPIPYKPISISCLVSSDQSSKKRPFENDDHASSKRQASNHIHSGNFISSDFISSDAFKEIPLNAIDQEKEDALSFPYFSGNQISNLIQSSFDPIFSED